MGLETLKGLSKLGQYQIVHMDQLKELHPEMFDESGAMDWKIFEREIRPFSYIYARHDKHSLSFTLQTGPIKEVGVNGAGVEGQEEGYELTKGKYDVRVISGAPYTTRRQEAAAFFSDVVKSQPDLMQIMGDLLFKNMDFTGAEAMAERMKKLIKRTNPDMIESEDEEQPAPDPEKMQMAQVIQQSQQTIAQLQQEMQSIQAALDNKQGDLQIKAQSEAQKAEADQSQNQIAMIKMRIDEEKNKAELELKAMELQLRSRELDIQEQKMQAEIALKNQDQRVNELEAVIQQIDQSMMQPAFVGQEIMGQP